MNAKTRLNYGIAEISFERFTVAGKLKVCLEIDGDYQGEFDSIDEAESHLKAVMVL